MPTLNDDTMTYQLTMKWCQGILHWQGPPATLFIMMRVGLQSGTWYWCQLIWVVRMTFSGVGWVVFKKDLACLILILQSACPQFAQYIFTWYLGWCTYNRRPPFYLWYLSFTTYHFHSTTYLLPVCFSNWGVRPLACTNLSVLYPVPRVPKIFRLLSYPLALWCWSEIENKNSIDELKRHANIVRLLTRQCKSNQMN